MSYLLDTNTITEIVRNSGGATDLRFDLENKRASVFTSIIVLAELRFGVCRNPAFRTAHRLSALLRRLEVVALDAPADAIYGRIRAELQRAGTPIGANDLFIAAHALALDATLVTAYEREFRRVPGLRVENWAA